LILAVLQLQPSLAVYPFTQKPQGSSEGDVLDALINGGEEATSVETEPGGVAEFDQQG